MTQPAATTTTVRVRLFASLRERAGWSERLMTPETAPATPLSLWRQLRLDAGGVGRTDPATPGDSAAPTDADGPISDNALPPGLRVAINQAFAAADTPLSNGDELAFLPPISGG